MDAIKAQLARLQTQFAALNATQRMLFATLVAVMAITLVYWSRYAGSPEMVPVIDTVLKDEQIGPIDNVLTNHNIPFQVVSGKVLVPADRKTEAVAGLMMEQALPEDKESAFVEMNKQLNPFSTPTDHDDTHVLALQQTLGMVIRHMVPGIESATVIINNKNDRRIEDSIPPSASVFVKTRDGVSKPKVLAKAIAKGVAGTVSGLKQENVAVTIDDHTIQINADGENGTVASDDLQDALQHSEDRIVRKIRTVLDFIPNLHVAVACDVENRSTLLHKVTHNKDGSVSMPVNEKENTSETTGASSAAAEPGLGANSSASIPIAGALTGGTGGSTSSTSETNTQNQVAIGFSDETTNTPAGKDKLLSATVLVPRSYLVAAYKNENKQKEPDDGALSTFSIARLANLKDSVKASVGITLDSSIVMSMYTDFEPAAMPVPAVSPTSSPMVIVSSHGKEIALGVLAVVSLFMMSSMVRKSTPTPAGVMAGMGAGATGAMSAASIMPSGVPMAMPLGIASLGGVDLSVSEASAGANMLDGVEMDEEAIRGQQVIEQVSSMVKENPDNAAALVKRWMART